VGTAVGTAKRMMAVLLVVALAASATSTWAQVYDPSGEFAPTTGFEKAMTKLGRGLSNVFLGWAEIPMTFDRNLKKGKPFAYLFGVAPVLGSARALLRTGTGVFEVVTFPFSDRDVNYEPILEPEYIF
jgi:putative exosortase-associated protein (TIGR04073 family)